MDSAAATEPWASKIGDATDTLFEGGERGIIAIPVRRTSDRVLRTWALRHVGDTGLVLRLLPQDGFLELLVGASPISCVEPGAPPFLLVQGDRDALVPHSQTDLLAAALADSGVEHQVVTIHGGDRCFFGAEDQLDAIPAAAVGFFSEKRGRS